VLCDPETYVMRVIVFASSLVAALVGLTADPALADKAPWCAFLGGGRSGGGTECLYYSRAQCMATVSGFGGYCFENPNYRSSRSRDR
jgi:hypothetical protein